MLSKRLSGLVFAISVAMAGLALSPSAWAQATTSLHGTVTDPSGASIPHAEITLTNVDTNVSRQTKTTSSGVYNFPAVQPGNYTLTVKATGFRTYVRSGIELQVNLPATVNIGMQVGAVSQNVTVSGRPPELNTTDASLGKNMGVTAINQLPLRAENMPLLLSYQAGVVFTGSNQSQYMLNNYDTRAGSVNGERSDQNNITLDGVSINNEFEGYAFNGVLPTTQFSVQEFRVTTSNYGASQGRSAGAQVAMVTKGGTNNYHGSLYEFNRNTVGEANDYFLKLSQLNSGQPNKPQHLVRNIFGGTLGGPIMKNRLFFFFNYEGHRQSLAASAVRTVPSATLRDGIIQYACATPSNCPGNTVTGLSGQGYTSKPGYYALGPAQLQQMDPLGIGPSQVINNYFKQYPLPNDTSLGDGFNTSGYRFAAPTSERDNWYIARLDYKLTSSGNHTLFWRGTGVDDHINDAPFLPGGAPLSPSINLSKGFVAGYTGILRPSLVNNFRFGLTRESLLVAGTSNKPWVEFRDISQGITRSAGDTAPVYNIVDTMNWLKGSHDFKFGGNVLLARLNTFSDSNSFSSVLLNSDWVAASGFAGQNDPLDPTYGCNSGGPCFPAVATTFEQAYDFPMADLMGLASEVNARFNYHIDSPTSATPLAQGAPYARHWASNDYNLFFEDTWRARRDLSITYGLNYQLMTPVTETAGQQVLPNVIMGDWFNRRAANMLQGIPSSQDQVISFVPGGSHWGQPGLYSAQKANFAPRIGVAWSPHMTGGLLGSLLGNGKTVIRGGFGMYYDNFGPELAQTYDRVGEFGLSATLQNPAGGLAIADVPRVTGMNTIPTTDNSGNALIGQPPSNTYPVVYPGVEAITRGIDQSLQTPYSYAADISVQRTLPGKMVLDLAYVGHFAHRLLVYDDIANPTDLMDPKSGISYFKAATRLSELARKGVQPSAITASMIGPTAQYWLDMVKPQATYTLYTTGGTTTDPLVATYDMFKGKLYNETSALYHMDLARYSSIGWPTFATGYNSFYNPQYSSLYVWRSIGHSNYNAFQFGLHKQWSSGVLFGLNYTYSKSFDLGSMAERGQRNVLGVIINPWSPNQMYGPSDFDLRNQLNGYWVAQLPFGRGKAFGRNTSGVLNALIGGWQLSGTSRWSSGFPANVFMGFKWPTNWEEMGLANRVGPVATGNTTAGVPNIYTNPAQAAQGFGWAYPGESGNSRNSIRGDGMLNFDASLAKNFHIFENQTLQFRWNVYNVMNNVRFDAFSAQADWSSGSFGNYSQTLTQPRVMEFSAVYRF